MNRPEDYEEYTNGVAGGHTTPADRQELCNLLGFDNDGRHVSSQGVSIASSRDYYDEYLARAEGRTPAKIAQPYWD
jgi:hypothetical protein